MNYVRTLITVAPDCPATTAVEPLAYRGKQTVATIQYGLLAEHPYRYTQEDVQFETYLAQNALNPEPQEKERLRAEFFSQPRACLRSSPLPKKYGWGLHFDEEGKVALCAMDSLEYQVLAGSDEVTKLAAMRSSRA